MRRSSRPEQRGSRWRRPLARVVQPRLVRLPARRGAPRRRGPPRRGAHAHLCRAPAVGAAGGGLARPRRRRTCRARRHLRAPQPRDLSRDPGDLLGRRHLRPAQPDAPRGAPRADAGGGGAARDHRRTVAHLPFLTARLRGAAHVLAPARRPVPTGDRASGSASCPPTIRATRPAPVPPTTSATSSSPRVRPGSRKAWWCRSARSPLSSRRAATCSPSDPRIAPRGCRRSPSTSRSSTCSSPGIAAPRSTWSRPRRRWRRSPTCASRGSPWLFGVPSVVAHALAA